MTHETNYTEIKAQLQSYAEDDATEFIAEIDTIINHAEVRLVRDLDLEIFKSTASDTLSSGTMTAPTASVRVEWVWDATNSSMLHRRSYDYVKMHGGSGNPKYFAEIEEGATIAFAPIPASSISVEIRYIGRPTPLSSSNETNWLSNKVGDLLLCACLVGAFKFLQALEKAALWEGTYQERLVVVTRELRGLGSADYGGIEPAPSA